MKKIALISSIILSLLSSHMNACAAALPATPKSVNPANVMNSVDQNIPGPEAKAEGVFGVDAQSQNIKASKTAENKIKLLQVKLLNVKHPVPANVIEVYQKMIGKRLSYKDIQKMVAEMEQIYREDGYILVQVILPPQEIDVDKGVVALDIVEGQIETVTFVGDNPKAAKAQLERYARAIELEDPISYRSIDRFLVLANELPGIDVSATVVPNKKVLGAADLIVTVVQTKASSFINVNNRGTVYIGPTQGSVGGSVYDVFGADSLSVAGATALSNPYQMAYGNVSYDIMVGSYGTEINPSYTETKTAPGSSLSQFDMRGNSSKYNLSVNQPLYVSTAQRLTLQSALYRLSSNNNAYTSQPLYNDQITALSLGLNYQGVFWQTYHDMNVSSTVGIPFNHMPTPSVEYAKPNFVRLNLNTSDTHYFTQNTSVAFGSAFQLTPNTLVSSEQLGYGGSTFGRAFVPSVISGDNGALGSLALRYDLPTPSYISLLQPEIFYDAGVVSLNDSPAVTDSGSFGESAGVGLNMMLIHHVQMSLILAKPLKITQSSDVPMSWQGFFNVTGTL